MAGAGRVRATVASVGEPPRPAEAVCDGTVEQRGGSPPARRIRTFVRRWRWLGGPVAVAAIPFAIVLVVAVLHVDRPWVNRGDYALIELSTRSAWRGRALVGPYSRYGWNHPGPAMFYWFAPFFRAFDQKPESLGVAAATLNSSMALGAVIASGVAAGRRAAWVTAAGVVAMVWVWGFSWIDRIWNPFIVLTPVVATGFLLAGVLSGRRWALVPLVAVASFTVQSHVGTAPVLGVLGVVGVVGVLWQLRRGWRPWVRPMLAAAGVGAVAWALPVYEQLSGRPGNLDQIVAFFRSSHRHQDLPAVLDKVVVQLTLSRVNLLSNVVSKKRALPPASGGRLWLLILLVGFVAVGAVVNLRARRRFEASLCVVSLAATAGIMLGTLRVVGRLEGYLTLPASAVGALLWASALLTASALAATGWARIVAARTHAGLELSRAVRLVAAATVVLVSAAVGFRTIVQRDPQQYLQVVHRPSQATLAITDTVRAAVPPGVHRVLVEATPPGIAVAAMLANQIERDGHQVRAAPRLDYFFGRDRRADGCERFALRVGAPGEPAVAHGGRVLGTYADQVVQARRRQPPPRCR